MDTDFFHVHSDCSSEVSETQSELEARLFSIIHHNDFSGTAESPYIDPQYAVEFNSNGEVVVFLKDPSDIVNISSDKPSEVENNNGYKSAIPLITLDDDDDDGEIVESSKDITHVADNEFAETSLKKKKKKKKSKRKDGSIENYIKIVKETNALEDYKEKSGLNKMEPKSSRVDNVALNVAFRNERAMPMTPNEVLKQYRIKKPTECSLWYRCPKSWTPEMIKFYTKIQKSKRNFDCGEELKKIKEKYGSSPVDWTLNSMDLYKSFSNVPKVRCNVCRQFGHTGYYCKEQYKPLICIMCGLEGHNFQSCNKKICLSCGTWQKKFTNNCNICMSMSRVKCNICNTIGHESSYCTESWRQFHSTISTAQEPECNEFAQSPSNLNVESRQSTASSSTMSTPNVKEIRDKESPNTSESSKSKKTSKRLLRLRSKKKHSKAKNQNNLIISTNESINIDVNIQDVVMKRTLTKRNFFKKKKLSVNS